MQKLNTNQSQRRVFVIGNGMTKFYRPGKHPYEYTDLADIAMKRALDDSKLNFKNDIQQVYVGYVYGDSCTGENAVYSLNKETHGGGLSGVPIVNVNNNCATGSTALWLANNAIKGGMSECVMALGFEKMYTGSLKSFFNDREDPLKNLVVADIKARG